MRHKDMRFSQIESDGSSISVLLKGLLFETGPMQECRL